MATNLSREINNSASVVIKISEIWICAIDLVGEIFIKHYCSRGLIKGSLSHHFDGLEFI